MRFSYSTIFCIMIGASVMADAPPPAPACYGVEVLQKNKGPDATTQFGFSSKPDGWLWSSANPKTKVTLGSDCVLRQYFPTETPLDFICIRPKKLSKRKKHHGDPGDAHDACFNTPNQVRPNCTIPADHCSSIWNIWGWEYFN